MVRLLSNQTYL